MDGSTHEHSDSDSGESWTLLENGPTYGDEAPDVLPENLHSSHVREHVDLHSDKDEDTDGISIISDSEPESAPCDLNFVKISTEESPAETQDIPLQETSATNSNSHSKIPVVEETDYLGDNVKYKTYVHKRNPKVGSILDIIMLGTFVITAGMALGHLWSCKNECTTQTSVNKILSNLYKLQEENALLRSKLKEITEATSFQLTQQRKPTSTKPNKQIRCKKIFEDPNLKNHKAETAIKCVDDNKVESIQDTTPQFEKELLHDIDRMKNIYEQNKEWLDPEVKRQFEQFAKANTDLSENNDLNVERQLGPVIIPLVPNIIDIDKDKNTDSDKIKTHKQINLEKQLGPKYYKVSQPTKQDVSSTDSNVSNDPPTENIEKTTGGSNTSPMNTDKDQAGDHLPEKKITYADSLKADQPLTRNKRSKNSELSAKRSKDRFGKRKRKDDDTLLLNLDSSSDDSIKKDDRYTPKTKHDRKKHDRQKAHKRQKRLNKYEQWEMKGGYLKDFDEFSVTSSLDNEILKPERKFLNADFENYVNMLIEAENNASKKDVPKTTKNEVNETKNEKRAFKEGRKKRDKDEWYDQRAALRAKARTKLEQELFGENTSNTAAWYFRRMQKREQCRAQRDNSTFKKLTKHKMNFKMKR